MLSLVAAALVAAAPADGGAPSAPFLWDVPGVDRVVPVGDRLEARGLPLKLFLAHSKQSLRALYRHYFQRFEAAGFYVDRRQQPLPGLTLARLTALDEQTLWSYTLIFYPEADDTTTLVLGAADLRGRAAGQAQAAVGAVPVLPGARAVTTSNVEFARSLSYETDLSADEVLAWHQATLPTLGWKETGKGVFVRRKERVRLLTRVQGKALQVVILGDADLELPGRDALEREAAGPPR